LLICTKFTAWPCIATTKPTQPYFIYAAAPLQGKTSKEKVSVEKEVTKKLEMTEKVMMALKEKGEVDSDLGIALPKVDDGPSASKCKAEKPSLDKLLAATKNLKSAYLFFFTSPPPKTCMRMRSPYRGLIKMSHVGSQIT
jgi:hypothetical protein